MTTPRSNREPLPCGWTPREPVALTPEMAALRAQGQRLLNVVLLATTLGKDHPDWRDGQCAFTALHRLYPACAAVVRGMAVDPSYQDERLDAFWDFVAEWTGEAP